MLKNSESILHAITNAVRGTAEIIGFLVFLLCLIGRTTTGDWILGELIGTSISKNGAVLTVAYVIAILFFGWAYKYKMDNNLN